MEPQLFSTRPDYVQSVRGLLRLHELALKGRDESPESEIIRDGLEPLWWRLTEQERARIDGLSEDLYSISDPPEPVLASNPQVQRNLVAAIAARQVGEWDRCLDTLRRWKRYIDPAVLSNARGVTWFQAGDPATAALFCGHASRLEPSDRAYQFLHLAALKDSTPELAAELAEQILKEGEPPLELLALAVEIKMRLVEPLPESQALPILATLAEHLEILLRQSDAGAILPKASGLAMTFGFLGLCYFRLGEKSKAIEAFDVALANDPNNDAILVARGMARYGDSLASVRDFQGAMNLNSPLDWPYYMLTHHYLVAERYDECWRMANRALDRTNSDPLRADLHEWIAIAQSSLGFPPDLVRAEFEEAVRLAPDNDRIRKNFALFRARQGSGPNSDSAWDKPTAATIQAIGRAQYRPSLPRPRLPSAA